MSGGVFASAPLGASRRVVLASIAILNSLVPYLQPSRPKIDAMPRRGLLQKLTRKEVAVFREPSQVSVHFPLQPHRGLRGDIAGVAFLAGNHHGVANAV